MFFAYLRPSEALRLRRKDLIPPGGAARFFAVHLHPEEVGITSKVGVTDETVALDSVDAPWLGRWLAALPGEGAEQPLLAISYATLYRQFKLAVARTSLDRLSPTVYQMRHGGPSHDLLHARRPRAE
eukprot:6873624-Lingulodinium_polyedra.AAC.1